MEALTLTEITKRFSKIFGYVGATLGDCEHCGLQMWHLQLGTRTVRLDQLGRIHLINGNGITVEASDEERFIELYALIRAPSKACDCGQQIWMVPTKSGGRMPMTIRGIPHFADCPNASYHRRPR